MATNAGKTNFEYQNKARDEKYERFEILAPKGTKEKAAAAAERRGFFNKRGLPNVSEYVLKLIEEDLKNDPHYVPDDFINPPEDPKE